MKKVRKYIAGLIASTALIMAAVCAMPAFASHTNDLHETTYYGAPGEELHGQVTIMNPSDETKVIQVSTESLQEPLEEWLYLDQDRYTIGPNGKAVVSYKIVIPTSAQNNGTHIVYIREISPNNTLSLKQTVHVQVVRPAAESEGVHEINIFYTTFFIMLVVAFGIGIAVCIVLGMKKISRLWDGHGKKKAGKRRK